MDFCSSIDLVSLDALDTPLLLLDSSCSPLFLNASGAKVLHIQNRADLTLAGGDLQPLVDLVRLHQATRRSLIEGYPGDVWRPEVLVLRVPSAPPVSVLAYARTLPRTNSPRSASPAPEFAVIFYDLGRFEPLRQIVRQAQRTRALCIATRFSAEAAGASGASTAAEARLASGERRADILAAVNAAFKVIDPLVLPGVRIVSDIQTSALSNATPALLAQFLAHLFLEAADFAAPAGILRVRAVVESSAAPRRALPGKCAEITIGAERSADSSAELSPLEAHLYSSLLPLAYSVTLADEEPTVKQLSTGDSVLRGITAPGEEHWIVPDNSSLSTEEASPNLVYARPLARQCGIELQIRRPRRGLLTIFTQIPLA